MCIVSMQFGVSVQWYKANAVDMKIDMADKIACKDQMKTQGDP